MLKHTFINPLNQAIPEFVQKLNFYPNKKIFNFF